VVRARASRGFDRILLSSSISPRRPYYNGTVPLQLYRVILKSSSTYIKGRSKLGFGISRLIIIANEYSIVSTYIV